MRLVRKRRFTEINVEANRGRGTFPPQFESASARRAFLETQDEDWGSEMEETRAGELILEKARWSGKEVEGKGESWKLK